MKQNYYLRYILFFFAVIVMSDAFSQLPKECMEQKPAKKNVKTIARIPDQQILQSKMPTTPAFIISDEEGPHSSVFESWFYYGFLKSEDSLNDEWLVFASFQRTLFGRYLIYNFIDLKTGIKKFFGYVDNPCGLRKLPSSHFGFKETEPGRKANSTILKLSWENNFLGKEGNGYKINLTNPDFDLHLTMEPVSSPMHVLGTGLAGLTKPEKLNYYVYPKLNAYGSLSLDSSEEKICGDFWYEHTWGGMWPPRLVKWTWWALQLQSGETMSISLVKNRRNKILQSYISMKDTSGKTVVFDVLEFEILQTWMSQKSLINYPVKWKINILQWDYDLVISPLFFDCEIPVPGGKHFWEGPCAIEAIERTTGKKVNGKGIYKNSGYGRK